MPLFREFPYTVAVVTPQLVNDQPDVVRRIAHTLGQANDMFHTRFGEAVDILKQMSPNIPGKAIESALERAKDSYPRGGRMTSKDVGEQHQGGGRPQDDLEDAADGRGRNVDQQVPELRSECCRDPIAVAWIAGVSDGVRY